MLKALKRPEDEDPTVTSGVLDLLTALASEIEEEEGHAAEMASLQSKVDAFAQACLDLRQRVASDIADSDPHAILAELKDRLGAERDGATRAELLRTQCAEAEKLLAQQAESVAQAERELRAALGAIGAGNAADADARIALSDERERHLKDQATAQQDLLDAGEGISVGDLRREVASISADDLQQQIEAASQAVEEANAEAQAASGDAARIESDIQGREADEAAVTAAAGKEAAFAKLNQVMCDAVVLHLASTLLEHSLCQVETGSSPALLQRISETFRSLTDRAFARVVTGENEKGVLRLMVEEPPDGAKEVKDISEGSRDQLFLALRLVSIEDHVRSAPALPFIADDLLQTFDDGRALAAFRVLLDFSHDVQVIILTHHEHLVQVAGKLSEGSFHIVRLERDGFGGSRAEAAALAGASGQSVEA